MNVDSFSKLILPKRTNVFFEKECCSNYNCCFLMMKNTYSWHLFQVISFWKSNMSVLDLPIGSYKFFQSKYHILTLKAWWNMCIQSHSFKPWLFTKLPTSLSWDKMTLTIWRWQWKINQNMFLSLGTLCHSS